MFLLLCQCVSKVITKQELQCYIFISFVVRVCSRCLVYVCLRKKHLLKIMHLLWLKWHPKLFTIIHALWHVNTILSCTSFDPSPPKKRKEHVSAIHFPSCGSSLNSLTNSRLAFNSCKISAHIFILAVSNILVTEFKKISKTVLLTFSWKIKFTYTGFH